MKILLRFAPILAGIGACGVVGMIGVMFSMNDSSGVAVKITAFAAMIIGFVVLQQVKNWVAKKTPQDPK